MLFPVQPDTYGICGLKLAVLSGWSTKPTFCLKKILMMHVYPHPLVIIYTTCAHLLMNIHGVCALQKEENVNRGRRGESPLPMTDEVLDLELNLKPVIPPSRLEPLLTGQQVELRCKQITEVAGEALVKLYMSEGLQSKKR